jgi:aryl-alcohol dehydrogenase-like predicted oxidoreductase
VRIATKVGSIVNEDARVLERMTADPDEIEASLDGSRRRLRRDRIDIALLHLNSLPIAEANAIFDRLEALRARGWIGHHGWSTDFPDRVAAMAGRPGLAAVEHAMNVFFAAEAIGARSARHGLLLPGFRTVEQVQDLVGVLAMPPVAASAMADIETVVARGPEGPPRDR